MCNSASVRDRLLGRAEEWRVIIDDSFETASSLVAYGHRGAQPVVLKVLKHQGDEWRSGEVLSAFEGRGVVRVYEHIDGALLLERLSPGYSLVEVAASGRDEEATAILAHVMRAMAPAPTATAHTTAREWGKAFASYASTGDRQIPEILVSRAHAVYMDLCESQSGTRLLHGDLQHSNVLFDEQRGWLAIDPKGVVGEIEYEVGAALRNPGEDPALFTQPSTIERRVSQFASKLNLNRARVMGWAFAQAVLSTIWSVEDGAAIGAADSSLLLAERMWPRITLR